MISRAFAMSDMATMPIRDLINDLGVIARRLEQQADTIDGLLNPDWNDFIEIVGQFLKKYPPDIFDGSSGDPGPKFIVALREAYENLPEASG